MNSIRSALCCALMLSVPQSALAKGSSSGHVSGYFRKSGTYVAPYNRSAPDGNFFNNYSTKGNTNPFTGKTGTKSWPGSSSYGSSGSSGSYSSDSPRGSYTGGGYANGGGYGGSGNGFGGMAPGNGYGAGYGNAPGAGNGYGGSYGNPAATTYGAGTPSTLPFGSQPYGTASYGNPAPTSLDDWIRVGDTAMNAADFIAAVSAYTHAAVLDNATQTREKLSLAYCQLGRTKPTQESIPFFHKALAITPSPIAHAALCEALKQSKRNPDSVKARLTAADIAHRLGDHVGEVVEYQIAKQLAPADPKVSVLLAKAYAKNGLNKAAITEYNSALSLGAKQSDVNEDLKNCITLADAQPVFASYFFSDLR